MAFFTLGGHTSLTEYENDAPSCSTRHDNTFHQLHHDAAYLICTIPHMLDLMTHVDAKTQFEWLNNLNQAIRKAKRDLNVWVVDCSGDTLHFVAGTGEGVGPDSCPPKTLFTLAKRLMRLSRDPKLYMKEGRPFRFSMGLDCGTLTTGVIGTLAWKYGVFGGPVTFATKLEHASGPGFLRISESAYERMRMRPERKREWEDGGLVEMMAEYHGQTYLYRDPHVLPDASPQEVREAYRAVDAAWTPAGVGKSVWRNPTVQTLFERYVEGRASPAWDIKCLEKLIIYTLICGVSFALASILGVPDVAPPLDTTSRHQKLGLPLMTWLLLVALLMTIVYIINVLDGMRGPNRRYLPRDATRSYRLGHLMVARALLAVPVLAFALANLPRVLVSALLSLWPDWAALAQLYSHMGSMAGMCPEPSTAPKWFQVLIRIAPASRQHSFTNLLTIVLPPVLQLLRVVSLVALALSSCLSRCYATLAAFASPLIAIFTALLRRSGYFSLVSWLGSGYGTLVAPYAASILLALPAGLFSILIPVRASENLVWGWCPVLVALVCTLCVGGSEPGFTFQHVLFTCLVGWILPLLVQYHVLERPLKKPFLHAIM